MIFISIFPLSSVNLRSCCNLPVRAGIKQNMGMKFRHSRCNMREPLPRNFSRVASKTICAIALSVAVNLRTCIYLTLVFSIFTTNGTNVGQDLKTSESRSTPSSNILIELEPTILRDISPTPFYDIILVPRMHPLETGEGIYHLG